jgi:hypothetical protein
MTSREARVDLSRLSASLAAAGHVSHETARDARREWQAQLEARKDRELIESLRFIPDRWPGSGRIR